MNADTRYEFEFCAALIFDVMRDCHGRLGTDHMQKLLDLCQSIYLQLLEHIENNSKIVLAIGKGFAV